MQLKLGKDICNYLQMIEKLMRKMVLSKIESQIIIINLKYLSNSDLKMDEMIYISIFSIYS